MTHCQLRSRPFGPALVLLFAACAASAWSQRSKPPEPLPVDDLVAPSRHVVAAQARPLDELAGRGEFRTRLADLLEAVQVHHVDPEVDSQDLVQGAIRGMLDTLDPHTHFLDRDSYRSMREGQDGSFYGLGIIISVRRDDRTGKSRLTVISPIDGMPAKRLGVRPGDIIAAIDGVATDGLTLDGAVGKLRGEKGSSVTITIERGEEKFDLRVERAEIPSESIQHAFMIRPGTGFIRIKDFTKTTTKELRESIAELRGQDMERLVLDLRDNPGGLLEEAVKVAGTFLDANELVVETRGRVPGSNEPHHTSADGGRAPRGMPLIVLVNRGSASASEIVAGAVQDHDRGLVVGGTTWGKGLVQSVYSLSEGCGLALTTARYYTPSGRQIQRDYRSSYFDYLFPRKGESPHGESHVTRGGRTVYSGGGIQPDVVVEEEKPHQLVSRLVSRSLFFNFAYKAQDPKSATAPGAPGLTVSSGDQTWRGREVTSGFRVSDADVAEFREYLKREGFEYQEADWTAAEPQVRTHLAQDIVNARLGLQEGFKLMVESDAQVQAALQLWDHAERNAILKDAKEGTLASWNPRPIAGERRAQATSTR